MSSTVSYDAGYDDNKRALSVVSCSDGINGLTTRYGWAVQGDYKGFPYLGGSDTIAGWNSPNVCFPQHKFPSLPGCLFVVVSNLYPQAS